MQQIATTTIHLPVLNDSRIGSHSYARRHPRKPRTSLENALELACAAVTKVLGVKYSFFYETGPAGTGYAHCSGVPGAALVAEETLHEAVFAECVRRNVPEYYSTAVGDSICIPVTGQGGRLGVLTAHAAGHHTFTDSDVRFLSSIAGIIATTLERVPRLTIARDGTGRASRQCAPSPAC